MTQHHAERSLFNALDNYMENSTNIQNMQQVAHNLNIQTAITSLIHTKFNSLISESGNDSIRKALDLLEYLTVFSWQKLAEVINDDKFMENMSCALMENDLLDKILNLLKFWSEEYDNYKENVKLVFVMLDNLEQFDIHLPPYYESPFKNMAVGPTHAQPEDNPAPAAMPGLVSGKITDFILRSKRVRDEAKQVLENKAPASNPAIQNSAKINSLLSQIARVCCDFASLRQVELNGQVKELIEDVINELDSYREKLHEKLNTNAATAAYPQKEDDSYKIVISGIQNPKDSEGEEDTTTTSSKLLNMDELLSYKVEPCLKGALCPKLREFEDNKENEEIFLEEDEETKELFCEGWHNNRNRKRNVYDDSGQMTYSFQECGLEDDCPIKEICKKSHNFFEKVFHPHNYKKIKCPSKNCINGRYCPFYHTMDEMTEWQKTLRQYFENTNESNEDGFDEEDNTSTQDIQTTKSQDFDTCPEDENLEPSKQSRYSNYINYDQSSSLSSQYRGIHNLSGFSKHNRKELYGNSSAFFSKSEPAQEPKGNLHTKLVIRKKYEDPSTLSQFFQKSQLFSGLPFFSYSPVNTNKNEESQVEPSEETVRVEDTSDN